MISWLEPNERWTPTATGTASSTRQRVDAENFNLALILNLIRTGQAKTRQEIERQSGLGRAIVMDRLATLMELGLIEEGELAPSTGGRAPRHVRFNECAGLVLLASIEGSSIGVAVADLSGRLLVEHHEAASPEDGPEAFFERLTTLFDWILEQREPGSDVWGIGIAVSGRVEVPAGQPFVSPRFHGMPGWEDYPLVERLAARYGTAIWVRGGIPMKTLGEQRAGAGQGVPNMIYVDLDREITAGLISEGHLHTGAQGGAGMIGHFAAQEHNTALCKCGNVGCLETAAGSGAIVREATHAAEGGQSRLLAETLAASGELSPADVGAAAQRGDPVGAELMARSGRLVGTALAELANAFNPSLIVLAGSVAQASDIVLATIREAVYRRSHPLVTRDLSIVRSQMSGSAVLVGTVMSVVDEIFATESLSFWVAHGSPLSHPGIVTQLSKIRESASNNERKPKPPVTSGLRNNQRPESGADAGRK